MHRRSFIASLVAGLAALGLPWAAKRQERASIRVVRYKSAKQLRDELDAWDAASDEVHSECPDCCDGKVPEVTVTFSEVRPGQCSLLRDESAGDLFTENDDGSITINEPGTYHFSGSDHQYTLTMPAAADKSEPFKFLPYAES